jgi:hypothetical protein
MSAPDRSASSRLHYGAGVAFWWVFGVVIFWLPPIVLIAAAMMMADRMMGP